MNAVPSRKPSRLDQDLEAEIAAALGDESLMALADPTFGAAEEAATGHRVGTIVDIGDKDVLIEFNAREQGICPHDHFAKPPVKGERHPFIVEKMDSKTGLFTLSLGRHATSHVEWIDLEPGRLVKAKVTGHNSGGLEVKISGHRGFIPFSQIGFDRVEDGSAFVDQTLECKVLEVDREKNRIILSRRAVLELVREEARESARASISVGDVRRGKVMRIETYGAFVDIGGIEGLLHVSNMDYARVEDPNTLLALGQEIDVKVIKVEGNGDRIALGMKQLKPDPWDDWAAFHSLNDMVTGKVTRIADYGAFVELGPGVEGLLHIGQLAPHRVTRVRAIVQEGMELSVRVANIDSERRRIGLSLLTDKGRALGDESEIDDETLKRYTSAASSGPSGSSLGALLREALDTKDRRGSPG